MNIFDLFTKIGPLIARAQSAIARAEAIIAQLESAATAVEDFLAKLNAAPQG